MNPVEMAIRQRRPALVAYLPAGFPSRAAFPDLLREVATAADVIEVGIPFSDPMADGATLRQAQSLALAGGASVRWTVEHLPALPVPLVVMSYLNPLLSYGLAALRRDLPQVSAYVVPDLPADELDEVDLPLVRMVAPSTPPERAQTLAQRSVGFLYAVSGPGTTGGRSPALDLSWLAGLRAVSAVPVCVGFGVRERVQVARLEGAADGVVVGTALVEVVEAGGDVAGFLRNLREV
jgi:tryptophan synthase alpha chain